MMIKFWMGVLISIALVILIAFLFAKIAKMMKKNAAASGLLGFFVGVGVMIYMLVGLSRAYVITGETDYDHYMVIGGVSYTMKDGKSVSKDIPFGSCLVINDTDDRVMIEEVIYGGFGFSPSPWQISAMTYELVESGSIDDFFEDSPPDEISVSDGADEVSKFWLRRAWD